MTKTNSWQEIANCYRTYFKKDVAIWQVNLWWRGRKPKEPKEDAPKEAWDAYGIKMSYYKGHRHTVEREVAPWDVVIRLSFKYIYEQLYSHKMDRAFFKVNGHFSFEKLNAFIYFLIWSKFERLQEHHRKSDGAAFMAPTFWGWAIDHKKDYKPILSKGGTKGIREIMKRIGQEAEDG